MGYSGRATHHYNDYWRHAKKVGAECIEVLPRLDAQRTRELPSYAAHIGKIVELARTNPLSRRWQERVVGVFSVGYFYNGSVARLGEEGVVDRWQGSLRTLREMCDASDVSPILIEGPTPVSGAQFDDATKPAVNLLERVNAVTRDFADGWAHYVVCDDVLGPEKDERMMGDQFHMNAAGYDRVVPVLVDLINARLDIEYPYPVEAAA
jgi:hypothetical protein